MEISFKDKLLIIIPDLTEIYRLKILWEIWWFWFSYLIYCNITMLLFCDNALVLWQYTCPVTILLSCDNTLVLWQCSCPVTTPLSCDNTLVLRQCLCPVTMLLSCDNTLIVWQCSCPVTIVLSCDNTLVLWQYSCPVTILLSCDNTLVLWQCSCPVTMPLSYITFVPLECMWPLRSGNFPLIFVLYIVKCLCLFIGEYFENVVSKICRLFFHFNTFHKNISLSVFRVFLKYILFPNVVTNCK